MAITERGRQLNVWMIIFTILVAVSFVGRYSCYRMINRKIRGDDVLVVISFVCLSVYSNLIILPTRAG